MNVNLSAAQIGVICNYLENFENKSFSKSDVDGICDYLKRSVYTYLNEIPIDPVNLFSDWLNDFNLNDLDVC